MSTRCELLAKLLVYKVLNHDSKVEMIFWHLITRYPQPVSPWLNLLNLMTPTSWAWTLASLATVALCFDVASLVVRRWMGMRLENIEIDLWPLRWQSTINNNNVSII